MQGYSHALSGATVWLAGTSTSGVALGWYDQSLEVTLAGAVLCAGAALLPDLDHPEGTISHSLPSAKVGDTVLIPSPTRILCTGVEAVSGGHRHGTHSILGIALFTALAYGLSFLTIDIHGRTVSIGAGVLAVLLVAFAVKALGISHGIAGKRSLASGVMKSWLGVWIIALGTAGLVTWFLDYRWPWLAAAVGVGSFLHCVGDSMTTGGVPWLWPMNPKPPKWLREVPVLKYAWQPNGYFRIPVLGNTDSLREKAFGVLMGLYVTYLVFFEVASMQGSNVLY